MINFPNVSPIMFEIGPLAIRWYSMAYLISIVLGWVLAIRMNEKYKLGFTKQNLEDLAFYVVLGVILGGRIGYVLFYGDASFWHYPLKIFEIWKGGMSFHGGIAGVILAIWIYSMRHKIKFLKVTDLVVLYVPIGIFLGRIANFINDELWGRVTTVPFAVRFPNGGYLPRHPSQLYEALSEGLLMLIILNVMWRFEWVRKRTGFVSATFAVLYGLFRMLMEQFREPDAQLGFYFGSVTMGQMLSLPLVVAGVAVMLVKLRSE